MDIFGNGTFEAQVIVSYRGILRVHGSAVFRNLIQVHDNGRVYVKTDASFSQKPIEEYGGRVEYF